LTHTCHFCGGNKFKIFFKKKKEKKKKKKNYNIIIKKKLLHSKFKGHEIFEGTFVLWVGVMRIFLIFCLEGVIYVFAVSYED
jgi:hypothetical protein